MTRNEKVIIFWHNIHLNIFHYPVPIREAQKLPKGLVLLMTFRARYEKKSLPITPKRIKERIMREKKNS